MALTVWPWTTWQSATSISAALFVYVLSVIVYRLVFHPLARYPGPLLSRIISLSVYLQASTGDRHLSHLKEHDRYGPIVRIAPNQLSFSSPAALRQIYQSSRANNPLRKSPWYETIDAPSGAYSTHTEISRTKHAFRRRVLDHAFSDSSLRSAEAFVIENADTLCEVLSSDTPSKSWSKSFNMSHFGTYLAYDIMGDLVFGKSFDTLRSATHRFVPKLLIASSAFVYPIAHFPFQFIIRPLICSETLMTWFGGELARDEHRFVQYANDRVTERLATEIPSTASDDKGTDQDLEASTSAGTKNAKERKDMMHYMLHAKDPITGQPFSRSDLDAESSLLIAAGADTTSTILAASFFYLSLPSSSSILIELQSQLRTQYRDLASIKSPSIVQHTYLRAIIDEVLRLCPPVPTHLPRMIVQPGGLEICGHLIPKGTIVGCPAYVLHHDETAYPDSFAFKPERWIPTTSEKPTQTHLSTLSALQDPEQVARAKEAFCAFSLGSRGCVGKALAYVELCVCLGRVLWQFDIRRVEGSEGVSARSVAEGQERGWVVREEEFQLKDCFLAKRDGPMVEFRRWERGLCPDEELECEREKPEPGRWHRWTKRKKHH